MPQMTIRILSLRFLSAPSAKSAVKLLRLGLLMVVAGSAAGLSAAERIAISWPTPSTAFARGLSYTEFLQHAGSGDPASGGFGCVRTNDTQFHEGIDIKAVARDRAGEPTDKIFAAMDGVVRYVNTRPGASNYGRYIVIEHPEQTPAVFTLYAHLSKVEQGIAAGSRVARGQTIATMGRSSSGQAIPKDRAHLHFEIGVVVTQEFQSWYNARKFGSANEHGLYNGMNLMGIDPLDFMQQNRAGRVGSFRDYLERQATAVRVRIATPKTPDFVRRYPALQTKAAPFIVGGWEVKFNWSGLPVAFTPLTPAEVAGLSANKPTILSADAAELRRQKCKSLAVSRRNVWTIGKDLETVLQQLFGLR
jgi:murein DD-endopeptidase MepM/ murein hydrolase activator NlpD